MLLDENQSFRQAEFATFGLTRNVIIRSERVAETAFRWTTAAHATAPDGFPPPIGRFAPSFPSTQRRCLCLGGNLSRTQVRNEADEVDRNRFTDREMDGRFSEFIPLSSSSSAAENVHGAANSE